MMKKKAIIYFDGACHLCSREINYYKKLDNLENISYVDISKEDFDHEKEGFDKQRVQQFLHVRKSNGDVVTGVDAFAHIWSVLGKFRLLRFLIDHQPSRSVAHFSYYIFSLVRPILPKKKCSTDKC
ncbi:MAG: hypothetical protein CMP11_01515 [Zetaproteobacteria bacterium]|nr:hypothetical protein [Pseudobdellovibrionaceae bacterium]|tara:strand:+ start:270 stop:647 length:378 start_codon:yes stop_codon:yes gene_type:complete